MNSEMKKKMKFLVMAQALFKSVVKYNNTEDESDEDELVSYTVARKLKSATPVRVKNYMEDIIPCFTGKQFQQHFRMSENVAEVLLGKIGLILKTSRTPGKPYIDEKKQLLSVIWLLATPDSYRSIAERFDMGKSSLWDSFNRVIDALYNIAPQVITWPETQNQMKKISDTFSNMSRAGLPNVIGAIDGCHIAIKAPQNDAEAYITRKCVHAITLQAICDCSLKFINCFAGYPGSVGDYRVFRNSDIYQQITENRVKYLPDDFYIVGDKAYPVLDWCIPPYIDRGVLTAGEKHFNTVLSRVRQTIERSFALLKGRFRRLKYLDMARTDLIPKTILACCVLHNICLADNDSSFTVECIEEGRFQINDEINIDHAYVEENGLQKRDTLMLNIQ